MKALAKTVLRHGYRYGVLYLHHRNHFPLLLNARGLTGQGAEVGVSQGGFSEHLLDSWKGRKLFSIDPWLEYPQETYCDVTNVSQEVQNGYYSEVRRKLAKFGERSCVLRLTSAEASAKFSDAQLDFVYIDAQHHYEAVKEDISLWYHKVKAGGILGGHDYLDGNLENGVFGVKSAVDEFVSAHKLKLYVSADPPFRSWFIFKNSLRNY